MIKSFKCTETEKIFRGQFSRKLLQNMHRVAARKLEQLNAATVLDTLRVPPGNRLEALTHDRLRLGRFFGIEAQFWMNLQTRYDLETTREALADRLEQEVRVHVG